MPDLRGLPLYRARAAIEAAGCVAASVSTQRSRDVPANTVLEQTPRPGGPILRGANVELVASSR
jgi:beta-lactam-binding protein with PASTA domain